MLELQYSSKTYYSFIIEYIDSINIKFT